MHCHHQALIYGGMKHKLVSEACVTGHHKLIIVFSRAWPVSSLLCMKLRSSSGTDCSVERGILEVTRSVVQRVQVTEKTD